MARPERHDVDYFPFMVKDGRTFFILEDKYQCKGIGFFANMCRFLSQTPDHYYCIKDEVDKMYFFSKVKCDEVSGIDMLNIMAKTEKIHKELWEKHRVITSESFLDSISDAYRNRKNSIITINEICNKYGIKPITYDNNTQESVVSYVNNTQTKLKETKLSLEQRFLIFEIFYFKNFKYASHEVERFINHYSAIDWKTSNGLEVKDKIALSKTWKPESKEKLAPDKLLLKWNDCYRFMTEKLHSESSIFLDLVPVRIENDKIIFQSNKESITNIEDKYLNIFKSSIQNVFGVNAKVEYLVKN